MASQQIMADDNKAADNSYFEPTILCNGNFPQQEKLADDTKVQRGDEWKRVCQIG